MTFRFVDLFAGIGGFHAALGSMGGQCVYASEWDKAAAQIYEMNWGMKPAGDITLEANDSRMEVPSHDVLVGGFPCQPFSKSGKQLGMEETRGTLFWNIAKIIEVRKPTLVLLENVRNLTGPRHTHEWAVIIATLQRLGYRVSPKPFIVSPHQIHPQFGGRPQVRERVFICATRNSDKQDSQTTIDTPCLDEVEKWNPNNWDLINDLPIDENLQEAQLGEVALTKSEVNWIEAWNDFVVSFRHKYPLRPLPGFPIWVDSWVHQDLLSIPEGTPVWKEDFLRKNSNFYTEHRDLLDEWLHRWNHLQDFPPSRRKLEWQAQETGTLWETVMHFRPSGIRAKKPTYLPALVAITQTSIVGSLRRRITVREAARLQGFPEWFDFGKQSDRDSYKQLGNAVNIGAVYNVLKAQVQRDLDLLRDKPNLVSAILNSPATPDTNLANLDHYKAFPFELTSGNGHLQEQPRLTLDL